jgi:iron complex outermembrane receptor protein
MTRKTPPPQAGVAAAGAQDDGDIIVTARRREERLSDIPGGASVIDQQTLLDRGGAATVSSLLAGQAGVRFLDTSSPINSEISIRASPTARATNADPSIGLYRNNVYIVAVLRAGAASPGLTCSIPAVSRCSAALRVRSTAATRWVAR